MNGTDPQGRIEIRSLTGQGAIASPNGKYVAIREPGLERNAWLLENF